MPKITEFSAQNINDMQSARNRVTIDIVAVRNYLHDGQELWEHRRNIISILAKEPAFNTPGMEFKSRSERFKDGLAKMKRLYELVEEHGWTVADDVNLALFAMGEMLPVYLHNMAFEPVFFSQASKELLDHYGSLVIHRGILGCYLQTELGHGTNVSALETTATYIPETREFELHSPTMTSTKWWIGALGKTSTHGVVQAKLILPDGVDVGPHLFFVQLRYLGEAPGPQNHRLLPGIIAGDIGQAEGPKAMGGSDCLDNGFARFNHIRVPKWHMLSRFAQVTDEGKYVKPLHAKISYGGTKAFMEMSERLNGGDASLLAELHAATSGLKVLCTAASVQDLETARRSMGGHGYSAFAGIGKKYADLLPTVTAEGENYVLDQQVVRAALKAFTRLTAFAKTQSQDKLNEFVNSLPPSSVYLRRLLPGSDRRLSEPPVLFEASWTDPSVLISLLEWRAALLVHEVAQTTDAHDATIYQRVSKAVTEAFVAGRVGEMLALLNEREVIGPKDKEFVKRVYILYLLTTIESSLTDFLSFGLLRFPPCDSSPSGSLSRDPTKGLRLAIVRLCEDLLPEAIGLTDAFGFTDWELDSALGVFDGQVYKALWERAQTEPLNQTEVPDGYEEYIRPMLLRGQRLAGAKL
ncbi:hypothetical protein V5O48_003202 [Marasmius crinis-equi]|uniref:Acyl-coenzyme A oxidase n=1 Tax=Marasmius crinis-equi TaxID=585013 RepID=A0ABR3FTG8_9AGAR